MKVPIMVGTVCFGSPYVGAGCVTSENDALVGSGSTGPELNRIEDALRFNLIILPLVLRGHRLCLHFV